MSVKLCSNLRNQNTYFFKTSNQIDINPKYKGQKYILLLSFILHSYYDFYQIDSKSQTSRAENISASNFYFLYHNILVIQIRDKNQFLYLAWLKMYKDK